MAIGPTRTTLLLRGSQTQDRYSLVEHSLPSSFGGPPPHVHRLYDHAWYVLEGTVQLAYGDQVVQATAGFEPYFEELAAAIPAGAPVDPSVVVAIQRSHDTFPPE